MELLTQEMPLAQAVATSCGIAPAPRGCGGVLRPRTNAAILPEGDAAVIRRHALVPARRESGGAQPGERPLEQQAILKAPARQGDARQADSLGDCHDHSSQRLVEPRGHGRRGSAKRDIGQELPDHRLPIEHKRRQMTPGAWSHFERIRVSHGFVGGPLEHHRRLAFEAGELAETKDRRDSVE